jgi:hypothetical protein
MPIYPAVVALEGNPQFYTDEDLAKAFRLAPGGAPDTAFLKHLEAQDMWWSHYAVLDGVAASALLRTVGEESSKGESREGSRTPASPEPVVDPAGALLLQLNSFQKACHAQDLEFSPSQIASIIEELDGHLMTDISTVQLANDLKSMLLYGGSLICEFPSLIFVDRT